MGKQRTFSGDSVTREEIERKKEKAERKRNPTCDECGEPKAYVDEPMVSGFRGYLCVNDDCVMDS